MKLTQLVVQDVRQFRQPFTLNNLTSGINLFVGPNESGKSTLVSAIRAAFFERYKSNAVKDLQPWGDSAATPEVSLSFEWQGQPWQLDKRFLKRQRCDLKTPDGTLNGDEAEEQLAELLGYRFSGRGASKAENWGIPGLLWVEQGQVQNINQPVDHASAQLQSVLSEQLGGVASSQGDALIDRIEAQSRELLTATGQPNKYLKSLIQADDDAQADVEAKEAQLRHYNDQVDELGRLTQLQSEQDRNQPWLAMREQAAQARQQLDEARQWQQQQDNQTQTLNEISQQIRLTRERLQSFAEQSAQLEQRALAREQAAKKYSACEARKPALKKTLESATRREQDARQQAQIARQASRIQQLQQEYDQLQGQAGQLEEKLSKSRALNSTLSELSQSLSGLVVDTDALKTLRACEQKLSELKIQQAALAGRLTFDLQDGQQIEVNGDVLSGQGEQALLSRTKVDIAGVGSMTFEPGGHDLTDLERQTETMTARRDAALQQLAVDTLQQAERAAERHREITQDIHTQREQLAFYAPKGIEDLIREQQQLQECLGRLTEQRQELPDLPDRPTDSIDAEQELDDAGHSLKQAEADWNAFQLELAEAHQRQVNADNEWQSLSDQLTSPERESLKEKTQNDLIDLQAREARFKQDIEQLQAKISAANPVLLEQDIQRLSQSAESLESDARERSRQIDRLQTLLEQAGATGLAESLEDARLIAHQAHSRRVELERRANALALLLDELRHARHRLTQKLQAPLQKHLNHYLALLFPGAELTVDDQLRPSQLHRINTGDASMDVLSYGAQEQMGLICRLAYADLLKEAGRPTLIILDDALVHSDRERLDQMKRILFDAATRHQVLLFSCHPENWRDLGVAARDLQALKASQ